MIQKEAWNPATIANATKFLRKLKPSPSEPGLGFKNISNSLRGRFDRTAFKQLRALHNQRNSAKDGIKSIRDRLRIKPIGEYTPFPGKSDRFSDSLNFEDFFKNIPEPGVGNPNKVRFAWNDAVDDLARKALVGRSSDRFNEAYERLLNNSNMSSNIELDNLVKELFKYRDELGRANRRLSRLRSQPGVTSIIPSLRDLIFTGSNWSRSGMRYMKNLGESMADRKRRLNDLGRLLKSWYYDEY
jgi:hypothetical protein